jgi:hypothetical protein
LRLIAKTAVRSDSIIFFSPILDYNPCLFDIVKNFSVEYPISELAIPYIEIRKDPSHPGIGLWQLEKFLGWPEKILEFHTWYLKEKGWIKLTETGGYAITASGIDVVEENELTLVKD